jgi:hypothetical protein
MEDGMLPNWLGPLVCLIVLVGFVGFAFRQGMKSRRARTIPTICKAAPVANFQAMDRSRGLTGNPEIGALPKSN